MPAQRKSIKLLAGNTAGTLGYFSLVMQFLWVTILYLPFLLENQSLRGLVLPSPAARQPEPQVHPGLAESPLALLFIGLVTLAMVALTIYLLLRIPQAIAKSGQKVTREVAGAVLPVITHHQKVTVAKKRSLLVRLGFGFKYLAALVLYLLLCIPLPGAHALDSGLVWMIGTVFFASTIVWFGLQHLLTKLYNLAPESVL